MSSLPADADADADADTDTDADADTERRGVPVVPARVHTLVDCLALLG